MKNNKTKIAAFLALVMLLGAVFAAFAVDTSSTDTESKNEEKPKMRSYVVENIAEMTALEIEEQNASVLVKGYYTAGDGGGGMFYWEKNSRAIENGGTAFRNDAGTSGRFVRLYDIETINVKWFGAKGDGQNDDTQAFIEALKILPNLGGTVIVPNGTYNISKTITVGDGNFGSQSSNRNGIHIVGDGNAVLRATEALDNMIEVKGAIKDFLLSGVTVDCAGKAKTGVTMTAFIGCAIRSSSIINFTKTGLVLMGGFAPTGNYNIYNQFENLNVFSAEDGAIGMLCDGDYVAINDTWLTTMTNCSFVTTGKDSIGVHYRFIDSISLYQCTYSGTKYGILFDAVGNNDFPCGMAYYDCSVSSMGVLESEDDHIRKHWFYGFRTGNGEQIPEDQRLFGITDEGKTFNMGSIY